jgi:hypothetical protein
MVLDLTDKCLGGFDSGFENYERFDNEPPDIIR